MKRILASISICMLSVFLLGTTMVWLNHQSARAQVPAPPSQQAEREPAVESSDPETRDVARMPWELLGVMYATEGITGGQEEVLGAKRVMGGSHISDADGEIAPIIFAAQPIIIDDFSGPTTPIQWIEINAPCTGCVTTSVASAAGILGGERDIKLTMAGGDVSIADAGVSQGKYSQGQGPSVKAKSTVVWDGDDGNANAIDRDGLGGKDLTRGGTYNAFWLQELSDDLGATFVITVYTKNDGGNVYTPYTSKYEFGGGIPAGETRPLLIPFSEFPEDANFADVGAIALTIDGTTKLELDVSIGALVVTPIVTTSKAVEDINGGVAMPGDVLKFTVTITNPDDVGDFAAEDIFFYDKVPDTLNLSCGPSPPKPTTSQGTVVECNPGYGGPLSSN